MIRFLLSVVCLCLVGATIFAAFVGLLMWTNKRIEASIVAAAFALVFGIGAAIIWSKLSRGTGPKAPVSGVAKFASTYGKGDITPIENAPDGLRVLAVDVESTGIGDGDELVELTLRLVVFDRETGLVIADLGGYHGYREPTVPISAAASKINGITMRMVRGQTLDIAAIWALADSANVCMGHYRTFLRKLLRPHIDLDMPWMCTLFDVDWPSAGVSTKLPDLAAMHGISIRGGTKSQADLATLLTLVQMTSPMTGKPYSMEVLRLDRPARRKKKATKVKDES